MRQLAAGLGLALALQAAHALEPEPVTIDIKLGAKDEIVVNNSQRMNSVELEQLLTAKAKTQPQPEVRLDAKEAKNYQMLGKLIYGIFRAGFEKDKVTVLTEHQK
ncbi:MAG TPA: biopolymer transporter ExbD [Telluria sp.]|nr:biopolymer transporter ExbD [Telluria sp.]